MRAPAGTARAFTGMLSYMIEAIIRITASGLRFLQAGMACATSPVTEP
jgi:hypothetical protein